MISENAWDELLQIKTSGLDDTNADAHHYRYEPTPYRVLERLADSGLFGEGDTVLDYGCGKGRVCFFLAHRTKVRAIGIEYDRRIYRAALENRKTAAKAGVDFVLTAAEEYEVLDYVNRCFFFNPFSVEILQKVMARILESWYETPRELFLCFYYPFDDCLSYLMSVEELEYYEEIDCGSNPQDRVLIFRLREY
ncbi:MAG: methyltransferase domain-containing protein [Ruminococcaceae bacterium]|nr:methyltransferase domain-containing protein [Oscillospiraceae bacterium]